MRLALAAAAAALLVCVAPASATTVAVSANRLQVSDSSLTGVDDALHIFEYDEITGVVRIEEAPSSPATLTSSSSDCVVVTASNSKKVDCTDSATFDRTLGAIVGLGDGSNSLEAGGLAWNVDVSGGSGNDSIITGAGADDISGGGGIDFFEGGANADSFTGGGSAGDYTTVSYDDGAHAAGVTVSVDGVGTDGNANDNGGFDNVRTSIDEVDGTSGSDNLSGGGTSPRVLRGLAGSDSLTAASTGTVGDTLVGGDGLDTLTDGPAFDTVSYDYLPAPGPGVVADITTGGGPVDIATDQDTYLGTIEQLVGSTRADNLTGGAGNDYLKGGGGNDLLSGGAGNDHLNGDGNTFAPPVGVGDDDQLTGGPGNDVLRGDEAMTSSRWTRARPTARPLRTATRAPFPPGRARAARTRPTSTPPTPRR